MSGSSTKLTINGADPVNLAKMTDYQQDVIVRRSLLQGSCGTLTLFSFSKGKTLSAHAVPFNAFIQVLDGQAEITIGEKTCLVNPGEIVLMPEGMPHKVRAKERFKMLLTMFKAQRGHKMLTEINKMFQNPADVFRSPNEILQKQDLSVKQKIEILKRWEYDERELAVAEEENMTGGPPGKLADILKALQQLEANNHSKEAPPTKQGG